MISTKRSALAAFATAAILIGSQVYAQQTGKVPASPRPADPTANLPSDTGSQTTLPSGAVTGAGQPQGTTRQRDVGAPGGLETRARREARGSATGATGAATATGATAAGAEGRVPMAAPAGTDRGEAAPQRMRRAKQSKG